MNEREIKEAQLQAVRDLKKQGVYGIKLELEEHYNGAIHLLVPNDVALVRVMVVVSVLPVRVLVGAWMLTATKLMTNVLHVSQLVVRIVQLVMVQGA